MSGTNTRRVILLGKTGSGKSSLANTIFGDEVFTVSHGLNSETKACQAKTKCVNGKALTLIDNPGFFDPDISEKDMKPEFLRCITESSPGPHAFLIVLKIEKYTEHEKAIITQMCQHFSEDALTHAAVVFTHGDQLPEDMNIQEFVDQSEGLKDLVEKCGSRCHVIDNKYWKNKQQDEYRSNKFQVAELLITIEKIVRDNSGGWYTNDTIKGLEKEILKEEEGIRQSSSNWTQEEIRKEAKTKVFKKHVEKSATPWIRGFVGFAVAIGLLATVTAVLMKMKSGSVLPEEHLLDEEVVAPLVTVVEEQIPEISVSIPAGTVEETVVTPVKAVKKAFEVIIDKLYDLYERIYNPWSPFD